MPSFSPFAGLRYDLDRVDLGIVTAPPYDVIDEEERAELAARSPHQVVRLDLPSEADGRDGESRYDVARRLLAEWQDAGVLVADEPSFYLYAMGFEDEHGRMRQTAGFIGELELEEPGNGILPHEQTTKKAKSDRLEMLRATSANLSAVWGLSVADGLDELARPPGPPLARWTDGEGVHHRLWRIAEAGVQEAIASTVGSQPVLIADGHHRYETSLQYRNERREAAGGAAGPWDRMMTYVTALDEANITVRPIHRLVGGLPEGLDLREAFARWFEVFEEAPAGDTIAARMDDAGALALVLPGGRTHLLRPTPALEEASRDLDSSRLDVALADLPDHELTFQHGVDHVVRAVDKGAADAGVLLRPATVAQIAATGDGGERMPPKTTFFHPKPRTGPVIRLI